MSKIAHLIIIAGVVSVQTEEGNKSVQSILDEAAENHNLKYRMRVESRQGTHRAVFGDDVYSRNQDELKAYEVSRAQVACYEALRDHGIPVEELKFSTMRRNNRGPGMTPSACIFLNPPGTTGTSANTETLESLTEQFFTAGGDAEAYTEFASKNLPEAAQRGWLKAQIAKAGRVEVTKADGDVEATEV